MSWLIIILSGCMEIGVVYNVKKSEGFTKLKYTLLCFMFIFFSVSLLCAALRGIPISVGYAVWTGIGSAGSVLMGMFLFKESKDMRKILLVSGIIICVIGLKLVS